MNEELFVQCRVKKELIYRTIWVQESLAKEGQIVKMNEGNKWEESWEIIRIYNGVKYPKSILSKIEKG